MGDAVVAARAVAQRLHRPPGGPVDIVRHLLAVQAQDERAMRLALRARGTGFTAADVDAALVRGELVVTWLFRGTLHLVAAEDLGWLLALTAARNRKRIDRRLAQLEVDPARAAEVAPRLPATRAEIEAALGTRGQQTPALIMRAAVDGLLVRAANGVYTPPPTEGGTSVPCRHRSTERTFRPRVASADEGMERLAARYAVAHAHAVPEDLTAWSGLPQGAVRKAFRAGAPPPAQPLGRRLLGMFDEYLLGFKDRAFAVPPDLPVFRGGMVRAVALEEGRAVATWTATDPPPPGFEAERADVERFLSGPA